MDDLTGRIALVTGASSGVGAAVSRALHAAGADVALLSRRGDDLGLPVVANAGVGMYGPFTELPPEQLDEMIDTNLKGTLYTAAATLEHLKASAAGDFISLASVAGIRAFPGEAVYNASKFGQVGFTWALDHELREHGVRATAIAPGGVNTEFAMGTGRTKGDPTVEAMMTPEDVAEVVLFALTRPRTMRMLTTTFRPMSEGTSG